MRYIIQTYTAAMKNTGNYLKKFIFSKMNLLYVLGDAMDRGPEPIRVIQDMIARKM